MNAVFVDTGYWIALFDKGDSLHQKALDLLRVYGARRLMTSEMVLTEFLNHFASRVYLREKAMLFVESIQAQTNLAIEPQTPELFAEALLLYKARPDKDIDCGAGITRPLSLAKQVPPAAYLRAGVIILQSNGRSVTPVSGYCGGGGVIFSADKRFTASLP